MKKKPKVVVVLPAYNAAETLVSTYNDIPGDFADEIILVDDASHDQTVTLARKLGLKVFVHPENRGYGANQKTCYRAALEAGADIVVMLHPDYQYDPKLLPAMVAPILEGEVDLVLGSRFLGGNPVEAGMPRYKYLSNRMLTSIQNLVLGQRLSEMHTGYRAYSRKLLETIPFLNNSPGFVFDSEVIVQAVACGYRIAEIGVPAKYMPEASSISFLPSIIYGLNTLLTLVKYVGLQFGISSSLFLPTRAEPK